MSRRDKSAPGDAYKRSWGAHRNGTASNINKTPWIATLEESRTATWEFTCLWRRQMLSRRCLGELPGISMGRTFPQHIECSSGKYCRRICGCCMEIHISPGKTMRLLEIPVSRLRQGSHPRSLVYAGRSMLCTLLRVLPGSFGAFLPVD